MNNLLETQNENGKKILAYAYKSLKDIDDVILQLLNEADVEGFIKSSVNRETGCVEYDVTGYVSLADVKAAKGSERMIQSTIHGLYHLLVYLEDSFIDIDYVLYDARYIFMNPDTKQIYLIVLPCQATLDADAALADCLENIIKVFGGENGRNEEQISKALKRIDRGLRSLEDVQEILLLLEGCGADTDDEPMEDWMILKSDMGESTEDTDETEDDAVDDEDEEDEIIGDFAIELDDFLMREENYEAGTTEAEDTDAEDMTEDDDQTAAKPPAVDMEMLREQMRLELRTEVYEEVREALRVSVREEVKEELRAEVRENVKEELRAEVRESVKEELREELQPKIRAEVCEELRPQLREEVRAQVREELRAEVREEVKTEVREELQAKMPERKIPYLIRKKTGQIIRINRDTFILGKMAACCDYVVSDNNSISRLHAVIRYREAADEYCIADCNSTNHTYLNGRRIPEDQTVTLEDRMHIHLATEEFIFRI